MQGETIPRKKGADDYASEMVQQRIEFIKGKSGVAARHLSRYSFDPHMLQGNIENFSGVAQVPVGFAGPLLVNGEHARGEFYVPLATTEGTLVASYNRGMKVIRESGGVKATVVDDVMQRAPVFHFRDAREVRDFGIWIKNNFVQIKNEAESTTSSGRLRDIEQYPAGS